MYRGIESIERDTNVWVSWLTPVLLACRDVRSPGHQVDQVEETGWSISLPPPPIVDRVSSTLDRANKSSIDNRAACLFLVAATSSHGSSHGETRYTHATITPQIGWENADRGVPRHGKNLISGRPVGEGGRSENYCVEFRCVYTAGGGGGRIPSLEIIW